MKIILKNGGIESLLLTQKFQNIIVLFGFKMDLLHKLKIV